MRIAVLLLAASAFVYGNVPLSENLRLGVPMSTHTSNRGIGQANALIAPGISKCLCDEGRRSRSTGKERDAETGLDYFGARYFSGAQGRFTSPDIPLIDQRPEDPQSWNLYPYGRNNPLRYTDPTGRCTVDGETHNWLWCAGHSIGLTQTVKEQADTARQSLSQMHGLTIGGQTPAEIAKSGTNEQVIGASRAATEFLAGVALAPCPPEMLCGVVPFNPGRPGLRFNKSLASEQQVGEILSGEANAFAGPGTETVLRDAQRLAAQHGGNSGDWVKIRSSNYKAADGVSFEIHAYQNKLTGKIVELKTKFQ